MKFKKKPEIVEATQFLEHGDYPQVKRHLTLPSKNPIFTINTLSGIVSIRPSDWIVEGASGPQVIPNDDFLENYEIIS